MASKAEIPVVLRLLAQSDESVQSEFEKVRKLAAEANKQATSQVAQTVKNDVAKQAEEAGIRARKAAAQAEVELLRLIQRSKEQEAILRRANAAAAEEEARAIQRLIRLDDQAQVSPRDFTQFLTGSEQTVESARRARDARVAAARAADDAEIKGTLLVEAIRKGASQERISQLQKETAEAKIQAQALAKEASRIEHEYGSASKAIESDFNAIEQAARRAEQQAIRTREAEARRAKVSDEKKALEARRQSEEALAVASKKRQEIAKAEVEVLRLATQQRERDTEAARAAAAAKLEEARAADRLRGLALRTGLTGETGRGVDPQRLEAANTRFKEATDLARRAQEARVRAAEATKKAEVEAGNVVLAIQRNASREDIALAQRRVQSAKVAADAATREARRIEAEYTKAARRAEAEFLKLQKAADKAEKSADRAVSGGSRPGARGGGSSALAGAGKAIQDTGNLINRLIDSGIQKINDKLSISRRSVFGEITRFVRDAFRFDSDAIDLNSLKKAGAEFAKLNEEFRTFLTVGAAVAGGVATAVATGLLGVAGAAVQVAAKFELLEQKLVTVLKSTTLARQRLQAAIELAAKTPFDVEGIVQAAVQLEVFKVNSEKTLPLVADLAAGMGRRIEDVALVIGKSMAGSLEGFEAMRNTLGITTNRLREFGLQVDNQGRILVRTTTQLAAAREAIAQIIQADFGGAVERQSRTLAGAISNLKDSVINLAASFGSILIPGTSFVVRALTDVINLATSAPRELKVFAVAAGGLAVAFSGLTLAAAGATAGLLLFQRAMATLATAEAGSRIAQIGDILLTRFNKPLNLATATILGFVRAIPAIVAIGTVFSVATGVVEHYRLEQQRVSDALDESSRAAQEATRSYKSYAQVVEDLTGKSPGIVKTTKDATAAIKELAAELDKTPDAKILDVLLKAGHSTETLDQEVEKGKELIVVSREQLKAFRELRVGIERRNQAIEEFQRLAKESPQGVSGFKIPGLDSLVDKKTLETVEGQLGQLNDTMLDSAAFGKTLDTSIKAVETRLAKLSVQVEAQKKLAERFRDAQAEILRVNEEAEKFNAFFSFAKKIDDIQVMNSALESSRERLEELKQLSVKLFGQQGLDTAFLTEQLKTASPEVADFIKRVLEGYDQVADAEKAITELKSTQGKRRLELIKFEFDFELATTKKTQEGRRLEVLKSERELVKGRANEFIALSKQLLDLEKKINAETDGAKRTGLLNEKRRLLNRVELARDAAQEEIRILREITEAEKAITEERVRKSKDAIETRLQNAKDAAARLSESGEPFTAESRASIFEKHLNSLKQLGSRDDLKKLRNDSESLNESFNEAFRTLQNEAQKARAEIPVERFKALQLVVREATAVTENNFDKLKVLQSGILAVQQAQNRGLINRKDAQKEIVSLEEQSRAVNLAIQKTIEQQVTELEGLRGEAIKRSAEILKSKREDARTDSERAAIDKKIRDREDQAFESEILQLRQAAEAEVRGGKNRELVMASLAAKEKALIEERYLAHINAERDKTKATEEAVARQLEALEGFRRQRLGGVASPLISLEELAFQSTLPGFGSTLESTRKQSRRKLPSVESFQAGLESRTGLRFGKDPELAPRNAAERLTEIRQSSTVNNVVVNVNATAETDPDIKGQAARFVETVIKKRVQRDKLTRSAGD